MNKSSIKDSLYVTNSTEAPPRRNLPFLVVVVAVVFVLVVVVQHSASLHPPAGKPTTASLSLSLFVPALLPSFHHAVSGLDSIPVWIVWRTGRFGVNRGNGIDDRDGTIDTFLLRKSCSTPVAPSSATTTLSTLFISTTAAATTTVLHTICPVEDTDL